MKILRSLRFGARVSAFCINTIVCWLCMELSGLVQFKRPRIDLINTWLPRWARINLWIFGVHVQRHGPHLDEGRIYPSRGANDGGRIFIANHSSGLDIPVMFTIAEAHCISRHDVATWPLIGRGARRVGTLFVDRSSRKSGAGVLREVEQALSRGEGVAMFPEGTVSAGDQVQEFRNGAFNAARRADAEIVPVGVAYGSPDAYYTDKLFMKHIKRIAVLSTLQVAIEVGEPLVLENCSSMEVKQIARERVQQLVDQARARLDALV